MSDMEYKEMAKVMTDEEVKTCMAILIEDSVILDIERNTIQNYIRVKYRLIGDHSKGIYWISLLSNSIEDVEEKHLRHEANAISQSVNIPPVMDCCRNVIILVTLPEVYIFQC